MPVCKLCSVVFPNRIRINGSIRTLNKRKYCLSCSPFGTHNTRILKVRNDEEEIGTCKFCEKKFVYNRKKGNRRHQCASCLVAIYRNRMKERAVEYLGGKCKLCGYSKCIWALEFNHRDPKEKSFGISVDGYTRSWERVRKELDKCDLLCSNCHREEEYKLRCAKYKSP